MNAQDKNIKIGDFVLRRPYVLAPLAGISDMPYRMLNRAFGCDLAFTEMLSVHALARENLKTMQMLPCAPGDSPCGIQIVGRRPDTVLEALAVIAPCPHDLLDINAACPVKKVVNRGEGAALMKEPDTLYDLVRLVRANTPKPVTVKLRAGWDANTINARDAAVAAEQAGACAIFVHGRTRSQLYRGEVDYAPIREVKQAVGVPVFGSGDVFSALHAKRMMDMTGCDGVVLARGALGNPWLMREIDIYFLTGELPPRPCVAEITGVMRKHLLAIVETYGELVSAKIYRKFFMWYTRGIPGVKPLRMTAMRSRHSGDMMDAIDELARMHHDNDAPVPNTHLPYQNTQGGSAPDGPEGIEAHRTEMPEGSGY